jgi:hypothetical protein
MRTGMPNTEWTQGCNAARITLQQSHSHVWCWMQADTAQAFTKMPQSQTMPNSHPYIQGMLKRTEELKEKRYKERIANYNKRNFRDYFNFESGAAGQRGITDATAARIKKWLADNK